MRTTARGGSRILPIWLAIVLGASVVLAVQAVAAWRSHRETAESVVLDYARLAARELKGRLALRFASYTCAGIARLAVPLERLDPAAPLPKATELADGLPESMRPAAALVRSIHCWDFENGKFRGTPPEDAEAIAASVVSEANAGVDEERGWFFRHDGGPDRIATMVREDDGKPVRAWIFLLDDAGVEAAVRQVAEYAPLLPDFLRGNQDPDGWLGWAVLDSTGTEIAQGGAVPDGGGDDAARGWTAEETSAAYLGDLKIRVHIRPEAASLLVPGGVPGSHLGITVALVLLSGAALGGAYRQVRREAELARLREDFLAGISHELRTPLAQIRMFAETLRLGRVRSEEERERSLDILMREAQRLSHLVDNVLVDSRSARGVLRASRRRTDVSRGLAEVADELAPLAEARGARVRKRIDPGLVGDVDEELLKQAVINLLDNAVKFGPRGQTVTVGAARRGSDLRIWVEDEGPGIPPADRARVGQRFFRLPRDREGVVAGTGIGLAVVRDVARLHDGELEIESADSRGARVILRISADGGAVA